MLINRYVFVLRCLLTLTLSGLSSAAFSADYYWLLNSGGNYPSPLAACTYAFSKSNAWGDDGLAFNKSRDLIRLSETLYGCYHRSHSGGSSLIGTIERRGNACPSQHTFDSLTGECVAPEPDKCEAKRGQRHSFSTDLGQMIACVDSCEVAADWEAEDPIKTFKEDVTEKAYWWVSGRFTGSSCSTSDAGSSEPVASSSEQDQECEPTSTGEDGVQVSSCTTTKIEIDNQDCVDKGGSVGSGPDGVMRCVAANKGPKAAETKVETKIETQVNPDGSKKETTTTTSSIFKCVGVKLCAASSTTTTDVSNTNADGTKGSESSTCTGDNCGKDGKSKEGKGEDGSDEGEEEGIPGPGNVLVENPSEGFGTALSEWDEKIATARTELDGYIDDYSSLFSGAFDISLPGGSGSLPCYRAPVPVFNVTIDLCLDDYEDQLINLRYILLALAAIMAGFIILRK